jgi:hypothetical protein
VARVARISDYGLQSTGSSQAIELDFVSDLGSAYWDDKELYVQFSTGVKSQGRFWTDLNDFHMDKHESPRVHEHSCTFFDRPNQDCNPIASLFYPITTTAFIQGEQKVGEVQRFSLHSDRPCGAASRRDGMIEVGLDRRLSSDDEKGLAQGVTDNVLTKLAYVLTFETGSSPVQKEDHTSLLSALVVESMSRPFTIMHGTVGKSIATREVSTWQNDGAVDWPCELSLLSIRPGSLSGAAPSSRAWFHRRSFSPSFAPPSQCGQPQVNQAAKFGVASLFSGCKSPVTKALSLAGNILPGHDPGLVVFERAPEVASVELTCG